jgi:two-component SAPR family response regulator
MESGLVNEAISMYKRTIRLNPKNEKAKKVLERLTNHVSGSR